MLWKTLVLTLWVAISLTVPSQGTAQQSAEEATVTTDPYGRMSPRGTVDGYIKAMREADPQKATLFLDTSGLSDAERIERARQLKRLLDKAGYFFLTDDISAKPEGHLDDEMSADLEEVGALQVSRRTVPLILQRVASADGRFIWLFSRNTLQELPTLDQRTQASFLDTILPEDLQRTTVLSVPIGHWLAILVVAGLALAAGLFLARLLLKALGWAASSRLSQGSDLKLQSIVVPLGAIFAVVLYRQAVILIGVQVVARGATDWIAVALLWFASAMLCLRLIDLFADYLRAVVVPEEHRTSLAALILLRKVAKALILAVLTVQILEIMGFDVTTAIAALGIGGLALALGAQKTVENLVGSVNVVADRPVEVGDFCKFGDVTGTVEDIGIRSTKIRTPARTIVTVPNGTFAAMQIENFAVRDQFLFQTVLSLRSNTTTDQLKEILGEIRGMLSNGEKVAPGSRVNLTEMTRSSLDIEIYCYIKALDYVAFLDTREGLLISILEVVSKNGTVLAFPPSLLEVVQETDVNRTGPQFAGASP